MQTGQQHPRVWSDPGDRPMVYISDEEGEDPLETFVHFIADKSKSLWKRVTSKARQSDEDETTGIAGKATVIEGERAVQSWPLNSEGAPAPSTSEGDSDQARRISKKIERPYVRDPL